MVYTIALKLAIVVLKKVLVVLKKKAAKTPSAWDDTAIEALEDVIALYENGKLSL